VSFFHGESLKGLGESLGIGRRVTDLFIGRIGTPITQAGWQCPPDTHTPLLIHFVRETPR